MCDEWDLSGNISQSLIGLQHLTYLNLSSNCFLNISIPKLLGSLKNLVHLDLSYSGFIGVIPHELGNLTRLRYLNLAIDEGHSYKVDDAEWLCGLSSLRYLSMDGANMFGVNNIMQSLNKLHHLKYVSLFDCNMNIIPGSLPHLNFTSLTFMDIRLNMFEDNTGIPEWLFRIPNLHVLYMGWNGLTGTIPSSVGNATSLQLLDLSGNRGFSSYMPRGFGHLCNLLAIHLDFTFIGKSLEDFRDAFSRCIRRNLNWLSFASSSLQGPLPDWLCEFKNLTFLDLNNNSFYGSIPESLGRLSGLQYLDLNDNALNGLLSESLGGLSRLQYLNLAYNALNGSIPESLGRLSGLQHLDLAYNVLNGFIPSSIGNATSLQYLDLSMNMGIFGDMPRGFGDLCNLMLINLGGTFMGKSLEDFKDVFSGCIKLNLNQLLFEGSLLQGPLPYWLGEFRNLTCLYFFNNSFHGSIPESLGRLSGLQVLDLRENVLNGSIPESLGRLSRLEILDLGENALYGSIPESLGRLSRLEILDLSENALNGSIPESLGRLSRLQVLDLRENALNGSIPESLWQLSNLFRLDLTKNNFNYSSIITEAHLANLTNLIFLWLDHLILNISTDWIPGFQAHLISLSYCHVGPKFPIWLANQVNLRSLAISNAGIKDSIPNWFWNTTYTMWMLDLSNNEINGRLPHHLKFTSEIGSIRIFLNSNRFEGSVPYFPPNVAALDLSNNLLSGIIPSDLGNFDGKTPELEFLSLSSNNLIGGIPNCLCNLVGLVLLKLSNNRLEGTISNCWNNLTSLQYLIMANNSLVVRFQIPSLVPRNLYKCCT